MQCDRAKTIAQAFSATRRTEIDAVWAMVQSIWDDVLVVLSEALPQVRKAEGRASILRYVGRFSRENEVAFRMSINAVKDAA